jgi:O-antigen/teichoic acid export membrane protein
MLGAGDSDRNFIVKETGGIFFVLVFYKGINFLSTILLARFLAVGEYGTYVIAFGWATLISVFALLGMDSLAVRELAHLQINEKWPLLRGFLIWAFRNLFIILATVVPVFIFGVAFFVKDQTLQNSLWMATLLIPAFGLTKLLQGSATGLKVLTASRVPDMVLQPLAFIFVLLFVQLLFPDSLKAVSALLFYAVTTLILSIGIGAIILLRAIPDQAKKTFAIFDSGAWWGRSFRFMFISILYITDTKIATLLLGFWASKPQAALYNVAARGTDVISFILFAFAPSVTRIGLQAYLNHQPDKLQRVVTRSVRIMLFISVPIAVLLIVWGRSFLLIFGDPYVVAYPAIVILSIGEIVNVLSGNLGQLLSVAGFEGDVSKTMAISLGINIVIGYLLIPRFGLLGAAIGEAVSLSFRNVLWLILARRKMNIQYPFLARW